MNITKLSAACSLLRAFIKKGGVTDPLHPLHALRYASLCNVVAHETRVETYTIDGVSLKANGPPTEIGNPEIRRAEILLEVADIYLKK